MHPFEAYLRAAYPIVWVSTVEPHRAEAVLARFVKAVHGEDGQPFHWDIAAGLRVVDATTATPCSPTKAISQGAALERSVTFLWNFHRFVGAIEVVQAMQNAVPQLKANGSCLVVLAPDSEKLPQELARFVATWDFPLPTSAQLGETLERLATEHQQEAQQGPLLEAALGLTASEAEDALALSIVERGRLDPGIVAREKASALLRQAKIQLSTFQERFDGLGGLEVIKEYCLAAARSPLSLGTLLLGPPGTGKSHFAKALGNELGVPTLSLDFGQLMSSLVGSSESNVRAALQAVDAMGRTVLFLDELEKGLAGVQSSGQLDSGVKAGVGSAFLKWMSDRKPGVTYIVATCNDISALPPEYTRSGRFDAIFWLDLPTQEERETIWYMYRSKYGVAGPVPDDKDWTGAEISSCCRTAYMLGCDLRKAADYIIPMAKTQAEKIEALRQWAKGRAIPASRAPIAASGRRLVLTA